MRGDAFRQWLAAQFAENTVSTQLSTVRRLEAAYGNLDEVIESNGYDTLLEELSFTTKDQANGRGNPSKLAIDGDLYSTLSGCRTALRTYKKFVDDPHASELAQESAIEFAGQLIKEKKEGRKFELERHLQQSLRAEISQLETGLTIIDNGSERGVDSGFIDITATDVENRIVVIELKKGKAGRDSIGQTLGYMGDLMREEPDREVRGILVAAEFDQSCVSSALVVANLTLRKYRFEFEFEDA